jgi:hypothetical protein
MIETILEAIFGGLIKWAASWLSAREASRSAQKAAIATGKAEVQQSVDRDATDSQVEADRETTNAELNQADSDAVGPNGVQRTSEDAATAVAAANDSVRGA